MKEIEEFFLSNKPRTQRRLLITTGLLQDGIALLSLNNKYPDSLIVLFSVTAAFFLGLAALGYPDKPRQT